MTSRDFALLAFSNPGLKDAGHIGGKMGKLALLNVPLHAGGATDGAIEPESPKFLAKEAMFGKRYARYEKGVMVDVSAGLSCHIGVVFGVYYFTSCLA